MKIMINHLGPVIESEIDLKPLTIFVGPNNMGKTWLAYSIANIFSPFNYESYIKEYLSTSEETSPGIYPLLEEALKQISNNGMTTIDMVAFAEQYAEIYFNNVAQLLRSDMPQFMVTQLASFKDLEISIDLADTKQKLLERMLSSSVKTEISGSQGKPLSIIKKSGSRKILAYYTTTEYASDKQLGDDILLPLEAIKETLIRVVLRLLHRSLYPQVRILPTERTTYITFPLIKKGRDEIDDLPSQIQALEARETYNKIIGSTRFFLSMMIRAILTDEKDINTRKKEALRNPKIKKYIELATLLEKEILGGEIIISQKELNQLQQASRLHLDIEQKVLFKPEKANPLEISLSSSMVKELSPLVLYLRYAARPDELIVIDEPEMNLHPEAQAKLIEFLVILVNAGLNILITTHSPYLIDHLANLIKAAESEDKETTSNKFYLKQEEAFMPKSKVSVHLFNQGYVTKAIDAEGEIDLSTFGDVSDRISDIYFEL